MSRSQASMKKGSSKSISRSDIDFCLGCKIDCPGMSRCGRGLSQIKSRKD